MIKTFSKKEESKLEEGNIKTIDNEQEVEDITVAVSTEVPEEVAKIEKDDKQAFEEFKTMYKGVIDIKCRQDFGDCEDEKLWEDTAKELFLQSKNYILVGDEYKAKEDLDDHLEKIEESKELKTESITENKTYLKIIEFIDNIIYEEDDEIRKEICTQLKKDMNVFGSLTEDKELKTEARENDVESRINHVKEWKQKVEDAVEATDLEEIVNEILEFAEDIKDNNFAGEDLYSGMSSVLDNGDAEARGPVTYVKSVKRDMQNILDDFIDNYEQAFEEESLEESNDPEFNYKMLDRLKSDCDYFLGNGNRSEKHLWAGNCEAQIAKMREIYNSLEEKPEWLSEEDINKYEKEMCSKQLEETKTFSEEDIEKTIKEYLAKTNGIFTDDSIYDIVEELCGESDIDKMPKDLVDQVTAKVYKDNKIEEKRTLPEDEKEILKNNMRKVLKQHGKFKDDEELEDYIEEFMPLWIEAQENLGTEVLPLDEGKEIKTEDQYEMERRKGRPNLDKIAKEVFEYDDYYIDVVDNFNTEREFIIEHIAEVAAEYNLKEQAAWAVMEKIYRMAKEAKSNKVEESMISEYTLNELSKVLNSETDRFKLKVTSFDTPEETKWLNLDREDLRILYTAFGGTDKKDETLKSLQENEINNIVPESAENERAFLDRCYSYLKQNVDGYVRQWPSGGIDITSKDKKLAHYLGFDLNTSYDSDEGYYIELAGGMAGNYNFYSTWYYEKDFDKLARKLNQRIKACEKKAIAYIENYNKPANLEWEVIDKEPLTYHCEKKGFYFNIYCEDDKYNLIVDYKEHELQNYDDIYNSLEAAQKRAEEIFKAGAPNVEEI